MMRNRARISKDGKYRYDLVRRWNAPMRSQVVWVMLNPSTADALFDDPTIRRCIDFSQKWGFDGLTVVNLFGLRATNPLSLISEENPRGQLNMAFVKKHIKDHRTKLVVAAWGSNITKLTLPRYNIEGFAHFAGKPLRCLGTNKDGSPKHPLYVPKITDLIPFGKYEND